MEIIKPSIRNTGKAITQAVAESNEWASMIADKKESEDK